MPTITISKKELEKEIGKQKLDFLKDRISMLGTDLEKIEGDDIVVEIFPNRPDMLSQQGFARALSFFLGKRKFKEYKAKNSKYEVMVDKSVKTCRPYTACAVVKNLKLDDEKIKEIIDIQEKLHITFGRNRKKAAIGIYPMENISFPVYFKGISPEKIRFVPLESGREMSAREILEFHPKGKEYARLLDGLKKYACFVDSKGDIMSLTPIINSEKTGRVTEKTKEVFIECSGFDLETLKKCLNMIVTSFSDMGGEVYSVKVNYENKKIVFPQLSAETMRINREYIKKYLGVALNDGQLKKALQKTGFGIKSITKKDLTVIVPPYRADILHPVDIIEDIAIGYGYENFSPSSESISTVGKESPFEKFCSKIREILTGNEFLETKSYHLINKGAQTKKCLLETNKIVELKNPVSKEYDSLRYWITPSLLETFEKNKNNPYPQNIFEIGKVFGIEKDNKVKEQVRVAMGTCSDTSDYTKARQVLETIFDSLELKAEFKKTEHPSFIKGRVARVYCNNKAVAYVGEISPEVLSNFGIEMPVSAFELNLSEIFNIFLKINMN